ncbi:MAG TPA: type VI secretion system baseplate subunit TssG [Bryobacteraceae bacterium]
MTPAPEQEAILHQLAEEPFRFEFFQAVRLLERLAPETSPVGRFTNPGAEVVRFAVHNTTAFPASEVQALTLRENLPPLMTVNFMGLTGPQGVLPLYYTLQVAERIRARDTGMREFLDIFNHRMISLFYQAWEKYRFTIQYERGGRDRFSRYLRDLIGLGTRGLAERQAVPDHALIYYAGILGQHPRSAVNFRQLLEDYFDVPVEIVQFSGAWYKLDPKTQCRLEAGASVSERLGLGAVVGDEVWDEQSRVRIRIGPVRLERYRDFLPSGTAYEPLRALARFYSGDELDFEVQLVLDREDVPACELGREDEAAPRLGWLTWARTAAIERDPGDTILEL